MRLLNTDTLSEARAKLFAEASKNPLGTKCVPFEESLGHTLAEDLISEVNIPDFRKSSVDGYAVRSKDTQGVTDSIPVFLDVIDEVLMGKASTAEVKPGQAVYVPTGGMVPEGADAVVMVEYAEKFDENSIAVYESVSPGRNVIQEGEDVRRGSVIAVKGTKVRPQEVGVMASAGVSSVSITVPWRISVISTGDELVDVTDMPEKGQTRDINTYSIAAVGRKYGFEVISRKVLKDDRSLIRSTIEEAMAASDVVLVSGGSSQGEKDFTAGIMDELAQPGVLTHGIALKPGKPTILAYDEKSSTVMAGLPGHPAAALIVFELVIGWLYRQMAGIRRPFSVPARMTENVASAGGKTTCQLVKLLEDTCEERLADSAHKECMYAAQPLFGKSGLMTMLSRADGYTLTDTDEEGLKEGQIVQVMLF